MMYKSPDFEIFLNWRKVTMSKRRFKGLIPHHRRWIPSCMWIVWRSFMLRLTFPICEYVRHDETQHPQMWVCGFISQYGGDWRKMTREACCNCLMFNLSHSPRWLFYDSSVILNVHETIIKPNLNKLCVTKLTPSLLIQHMLVMSIYHTIIILIVIYWNWKRLWIRILPGT